MPLKSGNDKMTIKISDDIAERVLDITDFKFYRLEK